MRETGADLIYLGICDRADRVPYAAQPLTQLNILGLRPFLASPIYPLSLSGILLVVAVQRPMSLGGVRLALRSRPDSAERVWMEFKFATMGHAEAIQQPRSEVVVASDGPDWAVFTMPFPDEGAMVLAPEVLDVVATLNGETRELGVLPLIYAQTTPYSPEAMAAIRSNPHAAKWVKFNISCRKCQSSYGVYAGIHRDQFLECGDPPYAWFQDVPDTFTCSCGSTTVPLQFIRTGLHSALGNRRSSSNGEFDIARLYETATLNTSAQNLVAAIDAATREEDVQKYLEANEIAFCFLGPVKLLKKPPILTSYKADFGILTRSGELILIEIEDPKKRIIRKDGNRTAEFTQALGQVDSWLHDIRRHRIACLESMGLADAEVTRVRGMLIMGRDAQCDPGHLHRLKSTSLGETQFLTYDDLVGNLESVIARTQAS